MAIYDDLKFFGIYQEEYDTILKSFRYKRKVTKDDIEKYEFKGCKVGDEIEVNPTPKTAEEAFFLLTNYYAAVQCVVVKDRGLKVYKIWNEYSLTEEKYRLEKFIDEANNTRFWFPNTKSIHSDYESPVNIYLKLTKGIYRHSELTDLPDLENSMPAKVYGEYVLYYQWIKAELRKIVNNNDAKPIAPDDVVTSVFADKAANEIVIEMLYDFEILDRQTNECKLNKKQNGILYAVIDAIIFEAPHLFATKPGVREIPSGQRLLPYFNSLIKRNFKEFDTKNNKHYSNAFPPAKDYIKKGFKL